MYITINELTSNDIKTIRGMIGMSQRELAELLNVSKPTVERWESGKTKISGPGSSASYTFQTESRYRK